MKDNATPFYKEAAAAVDAGLRKYMLNVFSYMSAGLAISAVVAYLVSVSPALMSIFFSSPVVAILVMLVPLGISIYFSARIAHISASTAGTLFVVFAACLGLTLAPIFLVYSGESIALTFFITSAMFLSMVIYGYVTGKDLTGFGAFLFMGLIGLIIASIVNLFVQSSAFMFVISIIGVVIFTGLTAYDTQLIKSIYFSDDTEEVTQKKAIFGALQLYLDFVNLFLYILRLVGSRRN